MSIKNLRAALSRLGFALATLFLLQATSAQAGVLDVRATNAFSGEALGGLEVYAMRILDGAELSFQGGGVTDAEGRLSLDLEDLGNGARYTLISNPYNGGFAHSDPIDTAGAFDYRLGALRVTAINGNDGTALADARLGAMRVQPDGSLSWQTEGVTDAQGGILLDLPELDSGASYKLYARSPFDGRAIYSEDVTSNGDFSFQVGDPLLEVTVVDGISHEPLQQLDLLMVELGEGDEMQWVSTGVTDVDGRVTLEVAGLGSGRKFQLLATAFNEVLSTSSLILEPGAVTFEVGRLRVSVVESGGTPIQGHTITAIEQLADGSLLPVAQGDTDAAGQIRFDLEGIGGDRSYILQASSPIDGSIKRSGTLQANGDFQFQVGSVPLSVTFTDTATGGPLVGETVYVLSVAADGSQDAVAVGETDSQGRVQFDIDAPEAGVELILAANPYDSGWVISQPVSASGAVAFSAGGLPVTLRMAGSGAPLPGSTLLLARRTGLDTIDIVASAVTDAAGQVHFDAPGLGEGVTYTVLAQNVFGADEMLFSPWVSTVGPIDFYVSGSENLGFDATPPTLEIESPVANGRVSAAGFLVTGIATDDQVVESVTLELNDPQNGSITVSASLQDDRWTAAVPASSLSAGSQTEFTVLALDRMGNETQQTVAVYVVTDTGAPQLRVLSHNDLDAVPASGFLLTGSVADDIGVQQLTATLRQDGASILLDDVPIEVSAEGSWALPVSDALAGTELELDLRALDLDGNETQRLMALNVVTPGEGVAHAISRITYGATPELLAATRGGDAQGFIAEQLNPEAIDESALEFMLSQSGTPMDNMGLQEWFVLRAVFGKRQLLEKMTWFWDNHFNTSLLKSNYVEYELRENEGFRQHALGRFRDLLEVSATSPAMLIYLDNVANSVTAPNENYARELLELHTLGVDGGYTENDVSEAARVLTGWWIKDDQAHMYDWGHDTDSKQVLGSTISSSDGREEVSRLMDLLAAHPSTARHICNKLLQFFVTEQPAASSVESCANTFLATDGDMRAVVESILQSPAFLNPVNHRNLAKTPLEYVVSLMRALEPDAVEEQTGFLMYVMGMPLFYQGSPEGYSESGEYWINASQLAQRVLAVNALVYADASSMAMADFANDPLAMFTSRGYHTAEAILGYMAELTLGNDFGGTEWDLAMEALTGGTGSIELDDPGLQVRVRLALALMLNAPGFQLQ